jgi:hypothetical protein
MLLTAADVVDQNHMRRDTMLLTAGDVVDHHHDENHPPNYPPAPSVDARKVSRDARKVSRDNVTEDLADAFESMGLEPIESVQVNEADLMLCKPLGQPSMWAATTPLGHDGYEPDIVGAEDDSEVEQTVLSRCASRSFSKFKRTNVPLLNSAAAIGSLADGGCLLTVEPELPASHLTAEQVDHYNSIITQAAACEKNGDHLDAVSHYIRALQLCDEEVTLHGKIAYLSQKLDLF